MLSIVDDSETNIQTKLTKSIKQSTSSIIEQIEKILIKAEAAHETLQEIEDNLETMRSLSYGAKKVARDGLEKLQYGSFWSNLFSDGKLGIIRNERTLTLLTDFNRFISSASISVGETITKLKAFKFEAEAMQDTAISLSYSAYLPVEIQIEQLQTALKRLAQCKEGFMGKRNTAKIEAE